LSVLLVEEDDMLYLWCHKDAKPGCFSEDKEAKPKLWAVSEISIEDAKSQAEDRVLSLSDVDIDYRDDPRRILRDGFGHVVEDSPDGFFGQILRDKAICHY